MTPPKLDLQIVNRRTLEALMVLDEARKKLRNKNVRTEPEEIATLLDKAYAEFSWVSRLLYSAIGKRNKVGDTGELP